MSIFLVTVFPNGERKFIFSSAQRRSYSSIGFFAALYTARIYIRLCCGYLGQTKVCGPKRGRGRTSFERRWRESAAYWNMNGSYTADE